MANKNPFRKDAVVVEEAEVVQVEATVISEEEDTSTDNKALVVPKKEAPLVEVDYGGPIMEVSLNDDLKINDIDKLKLQKGQEIRVSFLIFDQNEQPGPLLQHSETFFDDVSNTTFCSPKDPELKKKIAVKLGKAPNMKFGCVLLQYITNSKGDCEDYKLVAWVFGKDKFPAIKSLQKEWGLSNCDLKLLCQEEEFQKFQITNCRERWFDSFDPETQSQIMEEAVELHRGKLLNMMGRVMEDEKILETLGMIPAGNKNKAVNPFAKKVGQGDAQSFKGLIKSH